ncbi:MAG: hypothetical protein K2M91_02265 [Lachnospiraceae bacterium]|nr:hypothetical protein [Lachnospiraceae bacterium]
MFIRSTSALIKSIRVVSFEVFYSVSDESCSGFSSMIVSEVFDNISKIRLDIE